MASELEVLSALDAGSEELALKMVYALTIEQLEDLISRLPKWSPLIAVARSRVAVLRRDKEGVDDSDSDDDGGKAPPTPRGA